MKTAKRVETFAADRVLPLIANESPHPFASPSAPPSHIARGGLVRRLEAALDRKLVLVTAPAGYGKTALLRELWDALKDRDCVRVRPTPSGGGDFAAALVDACARSKVLGDAPELSGPSEDIAPEAMLAALARRLSPACRDAAARDVVIFIDDNDAAACGEAACGEAGRLLKLFLRQAPAHLRVIFAGRTEPACGAAKMRLDGTLAEFTRADLAFTPAETTALFLKEGLAPDASDGLAAKCEGWPAAVGLARLWLREGDAPCQAARFSGALPMVAAYIAQEMLADIPADMLDFLTRTALFPEVDADLADAALGRRDGAAMLGRLDHLGGFVFPVPGAPGRYRQHPLLADYFRARLHDSSGAEAMTALHRRAAAHFERSGAYMHALEHAAQVSDKAGDSDGMLIKTILDNPSFGFIAMTADRARFRRLMARLEDAAPGDARLAPGGALRHIFEGRPEEAKALLRSVKTRPTAPSAYAAADARLIDALYHLYTDTPDVDAAVGGLEKARGASAMEHPLYGGVLNEALGIFYFRAGRTRDADNALGDAGESYARAHAPGEAIRVLAHRAMMATMTGGFAGARGFLGEAHRLCRKHGADDPALMARLAVVGAALDYEKGEVASSDAAYHALTAARRMLADDGDVTVELMEAAFRIEAQGAHVRRGPTDAFAILDLGVDFARGRGLIRLQHSLMIRKVHLAAAASDLNAAQNFKSDLDRSFAPTARGPHSGFGWREDAARAFAAIRLEIAAGRGDSALRALDLFERTCAAAKFETFKLKSMALRALALAGGGDPVEAAHLARGLVEKGEALGARAFLLEEGFAAQTLLDVTARRFSKTKRAEAFNAQLVNWLIASSGFLPPDQRNAAPVVTVQQQRILALLVRGLDRNAIADAAETSTHNVQYHLKNMFDAFGVSSSTSLVAEAIRLGLVDICDDTRKS